MKITVVCEHNEGMNSEQSLKAYPEKMENCIANIFKNAGHEVTLIVLDKTSDGTAITDEILENTDVMCWWAHWHHNNVLDEVAFKVVSHVHRGMGFFAMHSGHHCKPFRYLMGTTGNLSWREDSERERVWVIDPAHPIAKGLDKNFVIEHEEMYGEQFDVPAPDELVFISWFAGGEVMRSGCVWKRGYGKVFFFRPGHETNPTYHQKEVQTVLLNAVEYIKGNRVEPYNAPHIKIAPEGANFKDRY